MGPASIVVTIVVLVPLLAGAVWLVREQLQARRNRSYKSLADHAMLNASDRATWMTGVLPEEGKQPLDLFSSRVLPVAQLGTTLVLVVAVLMWNNVLVGRIESQEKQIAELQAQVHALAFAPAAVAPKAEPDPAAASAGPAVTGTPMQLVCANLIGRVADAYEKAESSKIAQSLEGLVKELGCQKQLAPP
jgi:hypothetical protein